VAIVRVVALAGALSGAVACGASDKEIRKASTSGYDADFAIVYSETLAVVTELYPRLDENPSAGWIKTAWHQIRINQSGETHEAQGVGMSESGTPIGTTAEDRPGTGATGGGGVFGQTRTMGTLYFVRFRVYVLGGRPWRVRIEGEAAEYEPGMKPAPLKGAEVPPWLKGRVDALQVAVYRRLKKHAVKLDKDTKRYERRPTPKRPPPKLASYGDIPTPAAVRVHALRAALRAGDFDAVRTFLIEDFVWSAGGQPSADQALIMWRADPTIPSALVMALEGGCGTDGDEVACPAAAASGALRATFKRDGAEWKLASFVAAE
jgi:hypothetical protein